MQRTISHRPAPPSLRRRSPLGCFLALICAALLSACAGGSGSSGFELARAENRAIERALASDGCEVNDGLTICASDSALPTTTATARVEMTRTPTPTGPAPTGSAIPTGSPSTRTPTATRHASRTPTPTPIPPQPAVDINLAPGEAIPCQQDGPAGACSFVLSYDTRGVPDDAAYRVALRPRNPDGRWRILPATDGGAVVAVPSASPQYQIAVLVFLDAPTFVPDEVELLAESGADLAFVTPVLSVESTTP